MIKTASDIADIVLMKLAEGYGGYYPQQYQQEMPQEEPQQLGQLPIAAGAMAGGAGLGAAAGYGHSMRKGIRAADKAAISAPIMKDVRFLQEAGHKVPIAPYRERAQKLLKGKVRGRVGAGLALGTTAAALGYGAYRHLTGQGGEEQQPEPQQAQQYQQY